jgi:hypothetical protein
MRARAEAAPPPDNTPLLELSRRTRICPARPAVLCCGRLPELEASHCAPSWPRSRPSSSSTSAKVVYRLRDVILLIIVAGFIALLLNPLVLFAQRWVGRRGVAVAIVTVLALIFFAGLAVAFGYPLVNGITHLADNLPRYVSKAEHGKGWIGHLVTRYHVQNWVKTNAPKLASYGRTSPIR